MSNSITFGPEGDEDQPLGLGDLVSNADPLRGYPPPSGPSTPPPENQPCRPRVRELPGPAAEDPDPLVWVNLTGHPVALSSGSQNSNGRIVVNQDGQKSADAILWDRWKDHEVRVVVLDADANDEDAPAIPAEVAAAMEHNLDLTVHLGAGGYGLDGEWTGTTLRGWPEGGRLFRLRTAAEYRERRALVAKRTATVVNHQHAAERHRPMLDQIPQARNLADLQENPPASPPDVIEDCLTAGGNTLLVSKAKGGKTTMIHNAVRAMADGAPFLGRFTATKRESITVLDAEMPEHIGYRWLARQDLVHPEAVNYINLRGRASSFNIVDPTTREWWARRLEGTEVLVVDCLKPFLVALGLNENTEASNFAYALDELKTAAGIGEVIMAHHAGHNGDRLRGDSALDGWLDVAWVISGVDHDDDTARRFSTYGRADHDVAKGRLTLDPDTYHLTYATASVSVAQAEVIEKDNAVRESVVEYVRAINAQGREPGIREVREADGDGGEKARATAIRAAIGAGELIETKVGRTGHLRVAQAAR